MNNKLKNKLDNISLKAELFANLILVVLISIFASMFFAIDIGYNSLERQVLSGLDSSIENKEGQLLEFLNHQRNRTIDLSTDGLILSSTRSIVSGNNSTLTQNLNDHLRTSKLSVSPSIAGINIVDLDGNIIASSDDSKVGEREFYEEEKEAVGALEFGEAHITDIKKAEHFSEEGRVIRVFAPIVNKNGDVIAHVISYVTPDRINQIALGTRKDELGATPERVTVDSTFKVFIVNREGYIITESWHGDYLPFERIIDTDPYNNCQKGEETTGIYEDYNGEEVAGSAVCTVSGWTLVSEVRTDEAFAAVDEFKNNMLVLSVVLFGIAALIAYGLTIKNITPIKELAGIVESFGKGKLSKRASIESGNEVGKLAREFNRMADKIQELDESKTEFISFVSHQLKNPLSVISLNLQLLKAGGNTKEEVEESMETIEKTIEDINELINVLLNISRIEKGVFSLNKEKFNVGELVESIIENLKPRADKKNLKINIESSGDMYIYSDRNMLQVIIENLVSNSIKYTPNNGNVYVELNKTDNNLRVEVKDSGYGIPGKYKNKVFKKFFRANTAESGEEGTGLGLYMVQKLVTKMNGDISFESEVGKGTTFYVSLPLT